MPFKFNPLTGQLDLVNPTTTDTGNVTGLSPTTPTAIARWVDTGGTEIENSEALIQDSGAIEAQGYITQRTILTSVTVNSGESWISPGLIVAAGATIQCASKRDFRPFCPSNSHRGRRSKRRDPDNRFQPQLPVVDLALGTYLARSGAFGSSRHK